MKYATLFTLLPLAVAAPAVDKSVPELSLRDWTSIQSGFVDRVWSGLSEWSWNKAEEVIGVKGDESKTVYQQLKEDEQFSKIVKAIDVSGIKHLWAE